MSAANNYVQVHCHINILSALVVTFACTASLFRLH